MNHGHEQLTATGRIDWELCRKLSLTPGGFKEKRIEYWPQLLFVAQTASDVTDFADDSTPPDKTEKAESVADSMLSEASLSSSVHRDERQIGLDTDRSFVLYPVESLKEREPLQAQLHELIVSVFRKRQLLNYFQGYHDIISVLFLTLPNELQLVCAEKLSLHRLRDSMGASLEPVVGLLRVLKRLLRVTDSDFATLLEQNAPLPYFALSHILTLFSHDVPTLPLIQHIFDYLLCRPPIFVVYLAAAVVLSRREQAQLLESEGEEGMIHSLLSSLPNICEEGDEDDLGTEDLVSEAASTSAETQDETEPATQRMLEIKSTDLLSDTPIGAHVSDDTRSETILPPQSPVESEDITFEETSSEPQDSDTAVDLETSQMTTPEPDLPSTPHPRTESPALLEKSCPELPVSNPSPPVTLTSLLTHADELYSLYPPTHPSIAVDTIMGPQSVTLTWSNNPSELPSDDDAERMVVKPELVVRPFIEPEDEVASDEETDTAARKAREKERRRRHRKLRKPRQLVVQRKTMVAGAVLVLGVAMAVYGINAGGAAGLFRANESQHGHAVGREWRRVSKLVGGVLLGVGERVVDGLWH